LRGSPSIPLRPGSHNRLEIRPDIDNELAPFEFRLEKVLPGARTLAASMMHLLNATSCRELSMATRFKLIESIILTGMSNTLLRHGQEIELPQIRQIVAIEIRRNVDYVFVQFNTGFGLLGLGVLARDLLCMGIDKGVFVSKSFD
jgi:hypothetical protein